MVCFSQFAEYILNQGFFLICHLPPSPQKNPLNKLSFDLFMRFMWPIFSSLKVSLWRVQICCLCPVYFCLVCVAPVNVLFIPCVCCSSECVVYALCMSSLCMFVYTLCISSLCVSLQ